MCVSYSLGDAIDWKQIEGWRIVFRQRIVSYSLGDAIDWKLLFSNAKDVTPALSYSLGDAIDWKHSTSTQSLFYGSYLLLARGRDRLET